MKMIKKLGILAICSALILCGCSKSEGQDKKVDGVQVGADIFSATEWQDEVAELDSQLLETTYGIKGDQMDFKVWLGSGATSEELAVFVCKSKEDGDVAEQAAKDRVAQQIAAFKDYIPTEVPKLENALIDRRGDTVFLVVADDTSKAKDLIEKAYK